MCSYHSDIRPKVLQTIIDQPGIFMSDLCKIGFAHRNTIYDHVVGLCYDKSITRIRDGACRVYRLYPKGKEPDAYREGKKDKRTVFMRGNSLLRSEPAQKKLNKGHGDTFYMEFDNTFGLLYIDLRMMWDSLSHNPYSKETGHG